MRVDGDGRIGRHHQGVAVGRRTRHALGRHDGAGTGFVFNHHRLAQALAELLAQQTRHDINAATGRVRHHDANGLDGVSRLRASARNKAQRQGQQACNAKGFQDKVSLVFKYEKVNGVCQWGPFANQLFSASVRAVCTACPMAAPLRPWASAAAATSAVFTLCAAVSAPNKRWRWG